MKSVRGAGFTVCWLLVIYAVAGCESDVDDPAGTVLTENEQRSLFNYDFDWENRRLVLEGDYEGVNGNSIRYKRYEYLGCSQASVIFLNGRTEFIEKYDPLFTSLTEAPFETLDTETLADLPIAFYALDHEGQGESGGLASHIDDFDDYVENLYLFIQKIRNLRQHRRPIYLMSHSMGGLIAARFAQMYPDYVDGLILSSPMFGMNMPEGATVEQVKQLAAAYSAPQPYGLGMANRCAMAKDPMVLGMIAQCLNDETGTCQGCFLGDRTAPACEYVPVDWAAMDDAWVYLNSSESIGCHDTPRTEPVAQAMCDLTSPYFSGVSTDPEYCVWNNAHELAGPSMTLGWLNQAFGAIETLNLQENMDVIADIPTLVLSTPIDPIVPATTHGEFCAAMNDCQLVQFASNPEVGLFYFHELLTESDRASVVAEIRNFLP